MKKTKKQTEVVQNPIQSEQQAIGKLRKKTIKEIIAPAEIDATNTDRLEIISNSKRYARSFFVSGLPRMCNFPDLFI